MSKTDSIDEVKDTREALESLAGSRVIISWSQFDGQRNNFCTQLSVEGVLEQHPNDKDGWRVVASDAVYAYFKTAHCWTAWPFTISTGHAVISVNVEQEK